MLRILPPLSNSWIISTIWLYIALNRTHNIDCYWVGAVPKVKGLGVRTWDVGFKRKGVTDGLGVKGLPA